MNGLVATLSRELRAYFLSPLAYAVMALFLLVNGFVLWIIVGFLSRPQAGVGQPLEFFFGQTVFFWLVLLFVTPVLTMRSIAEERRSGTIEVLMTAPVSETQVVLGKFFASFLFYVALWVPTLLYVLILQRSVRVDWGPVAAGYVGILGIGALFLAVGIFASSLTKSQVVAALVTFAVLVLLFSCGLLENLVMAEGAKKIFEYLDLWRHMDDFGKGIVDSRRLVYYASATTFFLFLAARSLATRKWR